jgi:hypothetical protein
LLLAKVQLLKTGFETFKGRGICLLFVTLSMTMIAISSER